MAEPELDLNAGALAPVGDEVTLSTADVTVDGTIPAELNGTLVRNGPNPFTGRFEGDGMLSWWIGPAMVHGIAFESGRVAWYRNRWVRTGWWDRHHQPAAHPDPIRDTNVNVNVVSHAGRVLALG
jgi:carotenoid cleavage dioxygenase